MDLPNVMDDINAHAVAAAAAVDPQFVDVAVGFRAARGRCCRTYYAGEIAPPAFPEDETLNSQLIGERVVVDALWPMADISTEKAREQLGEAWTFKHELRTRLLGDESLGGDAMNLLLLPATVDEAVISKQSYLLCRIEIHLAYTEYALAL